MILTTIHLISPGCPQPSITLKLQNCGQTLFLHSTVALFSEMMSEAIKILKGEYTVRAIREHKMDKAIIFCRTKLDCDNMEQYLNQHGALQTLL